MVKHNENMTRLSKSYLFPEINRRKREYLQAHPDAKIISLGIGDTTQSIPATIVEGFVAQAGRLGTTEGYIGYGPEQGIEPLRKAIADTLYHGRVQADEVFVSDGSKCDIGRLLVTFGRDATLAVQDPTYPVYVDGALITGLKQIVYLPCTPENGFFPDLSNAPRTDLIAVCSPNNPMGVPATREQLEALVKFARANRSIILFDAAYAPFIRDPSLPRSIFEIDGAREVAIELGSFSKLAGFTGVRLAWTIVPKELKFDGGESVASYWLRVMTTVFNGASNIAQAGGLAALEPEGMGDLETIIDYYLANAAIIRDALKASGHAVYGGTNAPYLWAHFPKWKSWDLFDALLQRHQIITTPGVGFGPSGEGFIRLTAFGSRENITTAAKRLSAFQG